MAEAVLFMFLVYSFSNGLDRAGRIFAMGFYALYKISKFRERK